MVSKELNLGTLICSCNNCGEQYEVYTPSDFSYGERILLTEDGRNYAYINCLEDDVFDEVSKIVEYILLNKQFTKLKISECFNKVFGVACDTIGGMPLDAEGVRDVVIYVVRRNWKLRN